jgi:hypothetical protein
VHLTGFQSGENVFWCVFFTFVAVGDGGPGLVRVEVDVDASSSIGEEGVGQNHSFAVKGEIVSVVPAGKIRLN